MVLGNGDIVIASHEKHPDLFLGVASSFNTLGATTMVEIRLLDAKPYVVLTYHPISDVSNVINKIQQLTVDPSVDYLDGIMYSKTRGVIMAGRLADVHNVSNMKVQGFSAPWDPWFYLHAKKEAPEWP